jgi:hypothetical protein
LLVLGGFAGHPSCAGDTSSRPVEVYVMPLSRLDLFWAGTREECLARGNRIIRKAVGIASEHPDFRFLIESDIFVANYPDTHNSSPEVEVLRRLVKDGHIEIVPNWANILLNQPDGSCDAQPSVRQALRALRIRSRSAGFSSR